jgi:type I restriction enzyme S subunit
MDINYRILADKLNFNIWKIEYVKPLSFFLKILSSKTIKKGKLNKKYLLIDLKSIERKTDTTINIAKIDELGSDKTLLKYGDLIIPKLEPKKGQLFLNLEHKEYLGSTELIEYQIDKSKINPKFLYYLLVTNKILKVFSYLESGKTHRRVQPIDILKIKIPNIPLNIQNNIVDKIKPLEDEIKNLKSKKQKHLEIINEVFSNYFDIDLKEIKKLEDIKQFNLPLISVTSKNSTLRASYKWHKLETIQSYIYKDIDCIYKLDKFIINMNNGWSPESSEIEEGTAILGQEHIQKDGKISLNASKFTTKTKNNIENFYIKQNDFFVSRGNTIELVALASVVIDEVEEDILYPDLYIRVDFDKNFVNKEYMASLFNSFIGRIYFKHVAKGKNQTMVKVSSKELYDFYLPLPSLDIQEEIVKDIKNKIEEQDNIDKEIEKKQLEISRLIEDVIRECK